MTALGIYFLVTFILALLSLVVVLNFVRYRFEGDRTLVILGLFIAAFIGNVIITLSLAAPYL